MVNFNSEYRMKFISNNKYTVQGISYQKEYSEYQKVNKLT